MSCSLYQRSGDVGLGVPFNIASYSFLTFISTSLWIRSRKVRTFIGDAHIYNQHVNALEEQITRQPLPFPKMKFKELEENIDDYDENDIEWINHMFV